jgi:hypothetical protein
MPPVAWQDQVKVLKFADPFLGSFLAWITIRESTITSQKAIESIVRKVHTAARVTLLSVNKAKVIIDITWTIAPKTRYDFLLDPNKGTLSEIKPKIILQDQGI